MDGWRRVEVLGRENNESFRPRGIVGHSHFRSSRKFPITCGRYDQDKSVAGKIR